MIFFRSLLFNIAFWLWVPIIGLPGLPLALVYPPMIFTVTRIWGRGSLWLARVICGIRYEIRGSEHLPHGAGIVACKHQSAWDTIIFWALLDRPAYVLKRELIFYPVFGWYILLLKSIYIDRRAGASALKRMLREAETRTKEGRPIVIYPEGTRILPGAPSVYHPGIAALYRHLKLPVVPAAVNSGVFWSKNAFVKRPGKITLEFLSPIAPGMESREFLKLLQERIETTTNALIASAVSRP